MSGWTVCAENKKPKVLAYRQIVRGPVRSVCTREL